MSHTKLYKQLLKKDTINAIKNTYIYSLTGEIPTLLSKYTTRDKKD